MERTGKCFRNHLMGLVLLGGMMLGQACSVKEDRHACPCLLELDFICPDVEDAWPVSLVISTDAGFEWTDVIGSGDETEGYQVEVPRAGLHLRAWSGAGDMESASGIVIPEGSGCPRVYMHDSYMKADAEHLNETVTLRKNHCVLTLVAEGEGGMPSGLRIKGNVAGYDAWGRPLPGSFRVFLDGIPEGGCQMVLPRQTDSSLMLEADDGKGGCKAFALGQYIISSGYDWEAPDLEDVTVILDYALTEIRLVVSGWESVYRYDMEI